MGDGGPVGANINVCVAKKKRIGNMTGSMNPTPEQLDLFSAEVFGWTPDEDNILSDKFYLGGKAKQNHYELWRPSTDLSQAWREFVPVLKEKKWGLTLEPCPTYKIYCDIWFMDPFGKGKMPIKSAKGIEDDDPAYALTYAFCKALEPEGYLEWKEQQCQEK